jgi:hypothetical protein
MANMTIQSLSKSGAAIRRGIQLAAWAFLLASWLFPFYVAAGHRGSDIGFRFLFSENGGHQVDLARMLLTDLCIIALAVLAEISIVKWGINRNS